MGSRDLRQPGFPRSLGSLLSPTNSVFMAVGTGLARNFRCFSISDEHHTCKFNMIETVIIGHVWCGKLNQSHAENEQEKQCEGKKYG